MIIEPTTDMNLVADLMMHPDLFDRITDDIGATMSKEDVVEHLNDKLDYTTFLKIMDDSGTTMGIFECERHLDKSYELHPNMLKEGRGAFGVWAAKRVIKRLFAMTDAPCLRGAVSSKHLDVIKFISLLGFKLEYMVGNEFVKNNKEYDVYYFSLARECN